MVGGLLLSCLPLPVTGRGLIARPRYRMVPAMQRTGPPSSGGAFLARGVAVFAVACALAGGAICAAADPASDPVHLGAELGVVPLDSLWRFHSGDDPAWAASDFDDSEWDLARTSFPGLSLLDRVRASVRCRHSEALS